MLPKPIRNILTEFDNLLEAVNTLNYGNEALKEVAKEINLLKLWREEIESEKQSIYIIGKTSTGKSEFHNFILDVDNKKDELFKTSTKVETGIIQTLEHCSNKCDAYAEIIVKDKNEVKNLIIPSQMKSSLSNNKLLFPLNNSENIAFFRDSIIAKSNTNSTFDIIKAVERVNIKFPLKYLKEYKLIDTPGLASSISITDEDVKEHFQGKSFIFWFLDGSKRTLSGSLTLLNEEKELIENSVERISFIINKFDLMEYDDDYKTKEEVSKRKQELSDTLNQELNKILKKKGEARIHFTSFKKPKKKFPTIDTCQVLENIEDSQSQIKKESTHKNIHSLILVLSKVLESIKKNVIEKNSKNIEKKIGTLEFKKKEVYKLRAIAFNINGDTSRIIKKNKKDILELAKNEKPNTQKRFNKYVSGLNREIKGSCQQAKNSVLRVEQLKLRAFWNKLHQIGRLKRFAFEKEENFWKKYVSDSELKENKIKLKKYVQHKLESFDSLSSILNEDISKECNEKLKKLDNEILEVKDKKKYHDDQLIIISESEKKINNLDTHLLEDIEQRVSHWKPENTHDKIENFLNLYSLLQEHNIIEQKIIENG